MDKVIPSRITEAREARGLSMIDLADKIGITTQSVSKYERGIMGPAIENVQLISRELDFPIEFFYKQDAGVTTASSPLFFRSRANISKKVKTACQYQVKWADSIKKWLETYVDLLDRNVPTISADYTDLTMEDIEELSLSVRSDWGLSDNSVTDVIGALENNGILVSQFSTSHYCAFKGIDAFSSWRDGTPYIIYHSIQKSAVRTRFSVLHELGHLIMHGTIPSEDAIKKEVIELADAQADRFAAAFLLPATSFPKDIHGTSLSALEPVKQKWGAAFSTILRRCEDLDILSDNQLGYLKRQMTTKKFWHKEPLDEILDISGPEIMKDAIYLLIESNVVTRESFLSAIAMPQEDVKCICSLPDNFFDGYVNRQKPILRVL